MKTSSSPSILLSLDALVLAAHRLADTKLWVANFQAPAKSRPSFPASFATAVPGSMRWGREEDRAGMEVAGLISRALDGAAPSASLATQEKVRYYLQDYGGADGIRFPSSIAYM